MKKYVVIGTLIIFGIVGAIIMQKQWPKKSAQKAPTTLQVAASFYPLYYFTSQIVGDKGTVLNITPAGAEPHDYEPLPQDIINIEQSKLLVLNGQLEPWGSEIKTNLAGKSTKILEVGTGLISRTVTGEDGTVGADPHIWLDPKLAQKIVDKITASLTQIDPSDSKTFQSNHDILIAKLVSLDQEYQTGLAQCTSHDIITSHAAFGYLGSEYGLTQIPISGLSPDAEPSLQDLARIAKFARDNHVQYIFFESLVSPKLADTIASEVGAKTLVLSPLEGLTPGEIAAGRDYFSVMRDNLTNLRTALICQ